MSLVSIGDLARSIVLQRGTAAAKRDLDDHASALATGLRTDPAAALRGNLSLLAGVEHSLTRIDAWQGALQAVKLQAGTMQAALGAMHAIGTSQSEALLRVSALRQPDLVDLAGRDALEHLNATLGLLNANVAGRFVFSGTHTDQPAVGNAQDLIDQLWPLVAAAPTPAMAQTAINNWFEDTSGFEATLYRGGPQPGPTAISHDASVSTGIAAIDPALKSLLAGLAGAALLESGLFNGDPEARRTMAGLAGEALATNAVDRVTLAARLGTTENTLIRVETRNAAEKTALSLARSDIVTADPYEASTRLSEAETRLNLLYALTARMQNLSLLEALR